MPSEKTTVITKNHTAAASLQPAASSCDRVPDKKNTPYKHGVFFEFMFRLNKLRIDVSV